MESDSAASLNYDAILQASGCFNRPLVKIARTAPTSTSARTPAQAILDARRERQGRRLSPGPPPLGAAWEGSEGMQGQGAGEPSESRSRAGPAPLELGAECLRAGAHRGGQCPAQ